MIRALKILPILCSTAFIAVGEIYAFPPGLMAALGLLMLAGLLPLMYLLRRRGEASMIEWGMSAYVALGGLGFLLWPTGPGRAIAAAPVAVLYAVLFLGVALPPLFGAPLFTEFFAKKTTPEAVWQTDIFKAINRNMTLVWALLFAACSCSALMVLAFSPPAGPVPHIVFFAFIPLALLLGLGLPFTKKYPAYYQRKLGLEPVVAGFAGPVASGGLPRPVSQPPSAPAERPQEATMSSNGKIVAINGSPHGGIGNTGLMIEMFRPALQAEGFELEVITLHDKDIGYCTGCAVCIEKGKCWINDDHRGIVEKLLAADGVILGCPVFFFQVTAQMKTFLDRSLAWGHKPRDTYKPGIAVSVAAAFGEVEVGAYLSRLLHVYGAYSVGTLTAMATGPGGFMGKEAVQARATDLARDMVRAIKEKRRYPATSGDLFFYLHIGWLIKRHKDEVMKDDYRHWEEKGFYQGFEKFTGQQWEPSRFNDQARKAWIQSLVAEDKARKQGRPPKAPAPAPAAPSESAPGMPRNCKELIQGMPTVFRADQAQGVDAVIQFKVSGEETFDAYLSIVGGKCEHHEGLSDNPSLIIETPASVWLDISMGRLDGQTGFMQGLYKTQGDITLLMRLNSMFASLS